MNIEKPSLYMKKSSRNKKTFLKDETFNEIMFKIIGLMGIAFVIGVCLYGAVFRMRDSDKKTDFAPISVQNENYYQNNGNNAAAEQSNENFILKDGKENENEIKSNEIIEPIQPNSSINNELKSKTNIVPIEINLPEIPQSTEKNEVLHEKIQELPTTLQQEDCDDDEEEEDEENEDEDEEEEDDEENEEEEDDDEEDDDEGDQSDQEEDEDENEDGRDENEVEHQTLSIELTNHALPVNEKVINTETNYVENLNSNPSSDSNINILVLDPIKIEPAEQDTINDQDQSINNGDSYEDVVDGIEEQPAIVEFIEDPSVSSELVESGNYFKAIETNYSVALTKIIESGLDISALNTEGLNALHYAASLLNVEMMKILINTKTFDLDALTQDEYLATALMVVCNNNDNKPDKTLEAATLLITSGAKVDPVDSENFTPLAAAVDNSNHKLIEYLLKSGADVNAKIADYNNTILHQAMLSCDRKVLKILIDNNADIYEVNGRNMAPIHTAASIGCLSGLRELILTRRVDKNLKSPLMAEGKCIYMDEFNDGCMFGSAPLHHAADCNRFEAIEFLLLIQADLQAIDEFNEMAVDIAFEAGNKKIRDYLEKRFDWELKHSKTQDVEKLIRENENRPISENIRLDELFRKKYLQQNY